MFDLVILPATTPRRYAPLTERASYVATFAATLQPKLGYKRVLGKSFATLSVGSM